MFVTFRCKVSGNTVSFRDPSDIESMRKEENYEEVKCEPAEKDDLIQEFLQKADERKKPGRPRKVA